MNSKELKLAAQEIRNNEVSVRNSIEVVKQNIYELQTRLYDLRDTLSSLEAQLAAAYDNTDENGSPDYGRISSIESRIASVENSIQSTKTEISYANDKLQKYNNELNKVLDEKEKAILEIRDKMQSKQSNIIKANGIYGKWASVGNKMQADIQDKVNILSQAASILGVYIPVAGTTQSRAVPLNNQDFDVTKTESENSAILEHNNHTSQEVKDVSLDNTNFKTENVNISESYVETVVGDFNKHTGIVSSDENLKYNEENLEHSYFGDLFSKKKVDACDEVRADKYYEESNIRNELVELVETDLKVSSTSGSSESENDNIPIRERDIQDESELEYGFLGFFKKNSKEDYNNDIYHQEEPDIGKDMKKFVKSDIEIATSKILSSSKTASSSEEDDYVPIRTKIPHMERQLLDIKKTFGDFIRNTNSNINVKVKSIGIHIDKIDKKSLLEKRFIPQIDVKPLFETKQIIRKAVTNKGTNVMIFDHPEELLDKLPYKQGENNKKIRGTCGLANIAVWLNIAGSKYKENDIVSFATTNHDKNGNKLCSKEGGTIVEWRQKILESFGIKTDVYRYGEIEDAALIEHIAQAVETGRTVSIGVNSGMLWSKDNIEKIDLGTGEDSAFGDGGSNHVIGVVSCERDEETGEIISFYINDTGRGLKRDACRKVSVEDLKEAFLVKRATACISQNPVW